MRLFINMLFRFLLMQGLSVQEKKGSFYRSEYDNTENLFARHSATGNQLIPASLSLTSGLVTNGKKQTTVFVR